MEQDEMVEHAPETAEAEVPEDAERDAAADEERAYEESLAAACMQVDERQIFYKTLRLVRTKHDDTELREAIAAFPEMTCSVKTPRFFLERMRDTGALAVEEPEAAPSQDAEQPVEGSGSDEAPRDSEGSEASADATPDDAERPEGEASAAPADVEDSAASETSDQPHHASEHAIWTLTPAGERVLDQLSATKRLAGLYAKDAELAPAFDCILEFCREPKKRSEIEAELREQGFLNVPGTETSFYVDRLERNGGLVWEHAWLTTDDGLAFLGK